VAVYKRWKGRIITPKHSRWKDAHWTVDFMLRRRRVRQALPEARTQAQAEQAEHKLREDIYNRRYGSGRAVRLADFFEQTYLPTLKGSAHRDAISRGKLLTDFFGDQLLLDITARDVQRFKSSLKSSSTPRGSLRSGSTVNRYIYLLSAVCSHAITEEIMSENPCARINDEPEKERERYLTPDEQERMLEVMVGDLEYIRAPFDVSLHTGLRKNVELLKLKVGHLNFTSRPMFFPIHGGNVEIPPNWLIVVSGKRGKYRLIPMNTIARAILWQVAGDRSSDVFVFDKDANGINEYWIDKGFELACNRAQVTFGSVNPGGIIWHDLRRTFATRLRAHGVHEYDIQDLLGHSKPGVTKVYARATQSVLEAAVDKLTKPFGQVIEFGRRTG
jgi:integrase